MEGRIPDSLTITLVRGQNDSHTIVYITRVSEEARVQYTYLYRQQLYIYPGQSPVIESGRGAHRCLKVDIF